MPKGTMKHKKAGYLYVFMMLMVCGTAFGIYNLWGRFFLFHILAIIALVTLAAGMLPLLIKGTSATWRSTHLWFMYYSIFGLYAAFASELSVRIPETPVFGMVGFSSGMIFIIGTLFLLRKEKVWSGHFGLGIKMKN
jgi:uncharacterized membrane protein